MVAVVALMMPGDGHTYPLAVVLAFFSLLVTILNLPTLVQHYRNRNIGATALVAGLLLANIQSVINAIIWRNDDFESWFSGVGLCDIEVKLQIFRQTLFPASVLCLLRALANVMDTDRAAWNTTTAQKRRQAVIDLLCVVVAPTLQMVFHVIVQPGRYMVYGIVGCQASTDGSWLAFVLILLPPCIWVLADTYYAILIVVRLIRYRLTFNTILANSSTTKSRFLRLYLLAIIWILGTLPVEALTLYLNNVGHLSPFVWSKTHPRFELWNQINFARSYGNVAFADRYIYVAGGFVIFLLFGWGKDAMKLYRDGLLAIGLGRVFPALRPDYERRGSIAATVSTLGSKAKMMFHKKKESWSPTSTALSATDSMVSSPSPKKFRFVEEPRLAATQLQEQQQTSPPCLFCRFKNLFRGGNKTSHEEDRDRFAMGNISTGPNHINTIVSSDPISPGHDRSKSEVMVRTEVRQNSETADTLPEGVVKMYEGV